MTLFIGLDIGGTKFMVAAADSTGHILRKVRAEPSDNLETDLNTIHQMIEEVSGGKPIGGMGAAVGGPLDWRSGMVSPLHQPAWRSVPLKEIMEERYDCPFSVDVDTNIAALGEYAFTRITSQRFLYITISTGMGGGFLIDGKIYRGANGIHPEIAHQMVECRSMNPAGIQCECGVTRCLEALISGNGIRRIYRKPAEELEPEEWQEVAYNLGQGLRNMAVFYTPDLIRIGGGVALGGGDHFIQQAADVMHSHLRIVPPPVVELSRLGHVAPLQGALFVARHGLNE